MSMPKQLPVRAAARNNAEWCAAMSRSHGLAGEFGTQAWAAPAPTPLYYPDAVTLVPGVDPAALTAQIDPTAPGASVKGSFADLDLTQAGFQVLFGAQWIHRRRVRPSSRRTSIGSWRPTRAPSCLPDSPLAAGYSPGRWRAAATR